MKYRIQTARRPSYDGQPRYEVFRRNLYFWWDDVGSYYDTIEEALAAIKDNKEQKEWKPTVLFEGSYEEILQVYSQRTQQ